MDTLTALQTRRSIRSYRIDPVPRDMIEEVIACAGNAPTANNLQPWEFVVVTDVATRRHLTTMANHGRHIALAPCCIALFCKDTTYYVEDGAAATHSILLAAHALGLGACWVAGDKKPYAEEVRALLGVPKGLKLVSLVTLGYTEENPTVKKRPVSDLVHWERFTRR